MDEAPEDFAALFNLHDGEIDIQEIAPMLSDPPPMTWPAYFEKSCEALNEDSTGYPKMFARNKSMQNLLRNEQIRVEAARTDPIFDASEKLSKAFSYFCRHAGASLELEDWDGFLSL